MGLFFSLIYFILMFMFSWIKCPWCGTWFPHPPFSGQCKSCGRNS